MKSVYPTERSRSVNKSLGSERWQHLSDAFCKYGRGNRALDPPLIPPSTGEALSPR